MGQIRLSYNILGHFCLESVCVCVCVCGCVWGGGGGGGGGGVGLFEMGGHKL